MEQIRTEFYKIDMNNSDEILKFYKKHKLYYENLNKAIDKMTITDNDLTPFLKAFLNPLEITPTLPPYKR